jgi:hypothetical protein
MLKRERAYIVLNLKRIIFFCLLVCVSVGEETEDMTDTTFRPVFTSSAVKRDNRDSRDSRDQGPLDEASLQEREERQSCRSEGKGASASRDSGLASSQEQNSQEIT